MRTRKDLLKEAASKAKLEDGVVKYKMLTSIKQWILLQVYDGINI